MSSVGGLRPGVLAARGRGPGGWWPGGLAARGRGPLCCGRGV